MPATSRNPLVQLVAAGMLLVVASGAHGAIDSLRLDGVGDHIRVENDPRLNPTGGITIEAWIRPSNTSGCRTIVGKDFLTGVWFGLCDGRVRFTPNGSIAPRDGTQVVRTNEWTHVAVTFDGTVRRYYVNGFLDFEASTPGPLAINDVDLRIGADGIDESAIGLEFAGNLAEVRLWDRERDLSDIRREFVSQIGQPMTGLVAVWRLESHEGEVLRHHPGVRAGDASFIGPTAPPGAGRLIHVPLVFPPTLDGVCSPGEYTAFRLPIWYDDLPFRFLGWVSVGADRDLWVCFDALPLADSPTGAFAAVYVDYDGEGGTVPELGDVRVMISEDGSILRTETGNGSGSWVPASFFAEARRSAFEFSWSAEIKLSRFTTGRFYSKLQLVHHSHAASGDDHGWPLDFSPTVPDVWALAEIDHTAFRRADAEPPGVAIDHAPILAVDGEVSTLSAAATDDVDVANVAIFLDRGAEPVRACDYPGLDDRAVTCNFAAALPPGAHSYYAVATDHRGALATSPVGSLRTIVDGRRPVVTLSHAPDPPMPGQALEVVATASDASGIARLHVAAVGTFTSEDCTFGPATIAATCVLRLTVPDRLDLLEVRAVAEDAEGLRADEQRTLLVGPMGPDDDRDGLDNAIEGRLCTDPNKLDSDGDGLKDGWEVVGLDVPGAGRIDLPGMGANPCHKDVFLQYDYERGARVDPTVIGTMVATFARNGVALHVTENERPRPSGSPQSPWGAIDAAYQRDAYGDYYFDPKLNWTHFYAYSRHRVGRSGAWGRYFTFDIYTHSSGRCPDGRECTGDDGCGGAQCVGVCTCPLDRADPDACRNEPGCRRENADDQTRRFVHEIGHTIGLGHGGHVETPRFPVERSDGYFYYEGGWDNTNRKPNYLSVMNYEYNGGPLCMLPPQPGDTDPHFVSVIDYSTTSLGTLFERNLDERDASTFVARLREQTCPVAHPGAVPVVRYTCFDPDEPPRVGSTDAARRYSMVSDGNRTVARFADGGSWQIAHLPAHAPGIDWNCDGAISVGTRGSLNGDGADFQLPGELCNGVDDDGDGRTDPGCPWRDDEFLVGHEDWDAIPSPPNFLSLYFQDSGNPDRSCYPQPQSYRNAMGPHIDSRPSGYPTAECASVSERGSGSAYIAVPHDDVAFAPSLPGTEICNGRNDDGDDDIDEGCSDRDADGVADGIDNCPGTANADQADRDFDYLGDACQTPGPVGDLSAASSNLTVIVFWGEGLTDIRGYNVYRSDRLDPTPRFLGTGYPSTPGAALVDDVPGPGRYRYSVRAVDLHGAEGPEAVVEITTHSPGCVLDVDWDGTVDVATDLVYVARHLAGHVPAPPAFRALRPSIPDDAVLAGRVDAARAALDVDGNGRVEEPTDLTYIGRHLLHLAPVPASARQLDPTIPPDASVAASIDALCR